MAIPGEEYCQEAVILHQNNTCYLYVHPRVLFLAAPAFVTIHLTPIEVLQKTELGQ